jgi:hypothetical protein
MRAHLTEGTPGAEMGAWQIFAGLAAGVGALVGWYFRETLKAHLPSPVRIAGLIRQRDLPLPAGERFVGADNGSSRGR